MILFYRELLRNDMLSKTLRWNRSSRYAAPHKLYLKSARLSYRCFLCFPYGSAWHCFLFFLLLLMFEICIQRVTMFLGWPTMKFQDLLSKWLWKNIFIRACTIVVFVHLVPLVKVTMCKETCFMVEGFCLVRLGTFDRCSTHSVNWKKEKGTIVTGINKKNWVVYCKVGSNSRF